MRRTMCAAALLLACASFAFAQPVSNPTKVAFTVSVDHAQLTSYTIGYFLVGAASPVQSATLPLGTPDAQQDVEQPINSTPLGFGVYVAKVKANAGAVSSEWSAPSNEFARVPFPPASAPTVKK